MDYLMLFGSVALFAAQFGVMKCYQRTVKESVRTSLLFSAISGIVGAVLFFAIGGFRFSAFSVGMAAILAALLVASVVLGIAVVSMGSMSVYSLFMMLGGMMLPTFYGVIFLSETLSVFRIVGLVLLVVALALPLLEGKFGKNKTEARAKTKPVFYLFCILVFLLNGCVSVVSKIHSIAEAALPPVNFIALYWSFSAVLSLFGFGILMLFKSQREKGAEIRSVFRPKPVLFGAGYAIVNGTGILLQLQTAGKLDASLQFPVVTGGVVVLSALIGRIFFKEKSGILTYAGVLVAIIATVLFLF